MVSPNRGNRAQLILATGALATCFAVFGSASAMMPILKRVMDLDFMRVGVALAVPVLFGSMASLPIGMLADRFGPRRILSLVLATSAVAMVAMGSVSSYGQLLVFGFLISIALASFPVGAALVSQWYPSERQGTALGVYGIGNAGQSLAAFAAPLIAAAWGLRWAFWSFGVLSLGWLLIFLGSGTEAPAAPRPKSFAEALAPVMTAKAGILSLYYFLTFGGFIAMSVCLPTLLTDTFKLRPLDAGLRTAGFVLLATVMRPIGGMLADRIGGEKVLMFVFPFTALMALMLAGPVLMATFSIGALGIGLVIGLGNGAVFQLVPQAFPRSMGSASGLVGAAGGFGAFFPPLLLGVIRGRTGSFSLGFVMLAVFAVVCLAVLLWSRAHWLEPARRNAPA